MLSCCGCVSLMSAGGGMLCCQRSVGRNSATVAQHVGTTNLIGLQWFWRGGEQYLWQVQVDFIAVEVGVEGGAVGIVHPDRALAL